MTKEKNKEEVLDLETKNDNPLGILIHDNGEMYRELAIETTGEKLKLFNTLKDIRLDGETHEEYRMRKLITNKFYKEEVEVLYNANTRDNKGVRIPYVNNNKKDKFKKINK